MKKTIAILLVLVLAGVGLFAAPAGGATANLLLETSVPGINLLAVTATEFTGTNLGAWNSHNTTQLTTAVTVATGNLAYLNLITNQRAGVDVYMLGERLASKDNSTTNTYKIDYTVTCNSKSFVTASTLPTRTKIIAAADSMATAGLFMESYAIEATIDTTTFDSAPEDTYQANVTFTFVSGA